MRSYEIWFGDGAELAVLRVIGLFDRPARAAELQAVRQGDVIEGLVPEALSGTGSGEWKTAVEKLRRARLVAEADPEDPDVLDAHPLVREYFASQLQTRWDAAWREGNRRLYEHLKSQGCMKEAAHGPPQTLADLWFWYTAIPHGCYAGQHDDALNRVYRERVLRGRGEFSTRVLGATGADFAALYCFFEEPFRRVSENLSAADAAFVRHQTGYCLRAQGRLEEAITCLGSVLEYRVGKQDWREAAIVAGLISQTCLTAGQLPRAIEYGERAVEAADRANDTPERLKERTARGYMKHQAGLEVEAARDFREAEELRASLPVEPTREYELSRLLSYFHEADWHIDHGGAGPTLARLEKVTNDHRDAMKASKNASALIWLMLGRACLRLWEDTAGDNAPLAHQHLQQAEAEARSSGREDVLPLALLAQAECHRRLGQFQAARAKVEETLKIAERGGMRLYYADARLASARLHLEGSRGKDGATRVTLAREDLQIAGKAINEMCYHRRDAVLQELWGRMPAD